MEATKTWLEKQDYASKEFPGSAAPPKVAAKSLPVSAAGTDVEHLATARFRRDADKAADPGQA